MRQVEMYRAVAMAVTANFLRRPEIVRECGGDPDREKPGKGKLIRAAIARHQPICCYIDPAAMQRIGEIYGRPNRWQRFLLALAGYDWSELQKWRAKEHEVKP